MYGSTYLDFWPLSPSSISVISYADSRAKRVISLALNAVEPVSKNKLVSKKHRKREAEQRKHPITHFTERNWMHLYNKDQAWRWTWALPNLMSEPQPLPERPPHSSERWVTRTGVAAGHVQSCFTQMNAAGLQGAQAASYPLYSCRHLANAGDHLAALSVTQGDRCCEFK